MDNFEARKQNVLACSDKTGTGFDAKVFLDPKITRIENKNEFKVCVEMYDRLLGLSDGFLAIAQSTQAMQKFANGAPLNIDDRSIALEIAGHYYPQKFAKYLPDAVYQKLLAHTGVIDIGEKSVDDNRVVWDNLIAAYDAITGLLESGKASPDILEVEKEMRTHIESGTLDGMVEGILKGVSNQEKVEEAISNCTIGASNSY